MTGRVRSGSGRRSPLKTRMRADPSRAETAETPVTRRRGADRNRTGVHGFAGRCVATPPRRRGTTDIVGRRALRLRVEVDRQAELRLRDRRRLEVELVDPVRPERAEVPPEALHARPVARARRARRAEDRV